MYVLLLLKNRFERGCKGSTSGKFPCWLLSKASIQLMKKYDILFDTEYMNCVFGGISVEKQLEKLFKIGLWNNTHLFLSPHLSFPLFIGGLLFCFVFFNKTIKCLL